MKVLKDKKCLFTFQVCGVEHITTADPYSSVDISDGVYHSAYSYICRFALAVSIYFAVALLQVSN